MSSSNNTEKYDEVLTSILVNEQSILGFLSSIFGFLARKTDFYYIPQSPDENMGFPPGVAEELVVKVLRSCDPKSWKPRNGATKPADVNNEIMCSTVAQEVEVVSDEVYEDTELENTNEEIIEAANAMPSSSGVRSTTEPQYDAPVAPPIIHTQKNSETYNGAEREKYSWAQTITDLDITIRLPPEIKSSKDLKVTINAGDICVAPCNSDFIIKDTLPYKINSLESFWSISEGKLLIHLEKVQERWWNRLLNGEEPIDLDKIDCSRSLYELPDDHIDKVIELQWNEEQKRKGLPTSSQIRKIEILKKAWNAEGSPFKGKEFDPSVLNL